ncbi:hypothetical protein A0H81_14891 [Grifola frondosa]|uniref:Uncharacterized protein n=1 Tax=Grifola frondosa TaxID=5627 RepID=A0A1C7LJZ9_GRIFR|nr:hypothetical protein A0H81_14891 [Grifola frondosa]
MAYISEPLPCLTVSLTPHTCPRSFPSPSSCIAPVALVLHAHPCSTLCPSRTPLIHGRIYASRPHLCPCSSLEHFFAKSSIRMSPTRISSLRPPPKRDGKTPPHTMPDHLLPTIHVHTLHSYAYPIIHACSLLCAAPRDSCPRPSLTNAHALRALNDSLRVSAHEQLQHPTQLPHLPRAHKCVLWRNVRTYGWQSVQAAQAETEGMGTEQGHGCERGAGTKEMHKVHELHSGKLMELARIIAAALVSVQHDLLPAWLVQHMHRNTDIEFPMHNAQVEAKAKKKLGMLGLFRWKLHVDENVHIAWTLSSMSNLQHHWHFLLHVAEVHDGGIWC